MNLRHLGVVSLLALAVSCSQGGMFQEVTNIHFWTQSVTGQQLYVPSSKLLIVVDDSESMANEINQLKSRTLGFINTIQNQGIRFDIYLTRLSHIDVSHLQVARRVRLLPGKALAHGSNGNLSQVQSFLNSLAPVPGLGGQDQLEPLIALAAHSFELIYPANQPIERRESFHVIFLTDENDDSSTTDGTDGTILVEEGNLFRYEYTLGVGTKAFSTNRFCTRNNLPAGFNINDSTHHDQTYCTAPGGYSGGWHTSRHGYYWCERSQSYRCEETGDSGQPRGTYVTEAYNSYWNWPAWEKIVAGNYASCDGQGPRVRFVTHPGIINYSGANPSLVDFKNDHSGCAYVSCTENYAVGVRHINYSAIQTRACSGNFPNEVFSTGKNAGFLWVSSDTRVENEYLHPNVLMTPTDVKTVKKIYESEVELTNEELMAILVEKHAPTFEFKQYLMGRFPTEPSKWDWAKIEIIGLVGGARSEIALSSQPEEFSQYLESRFPLVNLISHGVVVSGGAACAANRGNEVGHAYIQLATATRGVISDVCNPNFEDFITSLTRSVVSEAAPVYELLAPLQRGAYLEVLHVQNNRILREPEDYRVDGAFIIFEQNVLLAGEEVTLSVREHR